MKNNRHYITAVALMVLATLSSCRKELCYNHFPAIDISFSWEKEWERDYGASHAANWNSMLYGVTYDELRPTVPEWVMMVKYKEGKDPEERFLGPDGGRLIVGENERQSFLFYNGDTECIVLSDMASLPGVTASTTSRSRSSIVGLTEKYPNARSTNQPDLFYSAFIEDVPLVLTHEVKDLPIKMQPLVYTYLVRYEFEYGLQHVRLARGALGGMAEAVYLRDGVTSDKPTIILYDCEIKPYGCEAKVRSFGIPGFPDEYYGRAVTLAEERPYTLNLEVMLQNGKTVEFNFDISDQMANQPRGGVITVKGLCVEDEQSTSESGFDVEVSGWDNHVNVNLPVGTK